MSNTFLSSLHGSDLSQLTNGTASLFLKSLKVNDLEGSKTVLTDNEKYLSTGAGLDLTELQNKTQNISADATQTTFGNRVNISGLLDVAGQTTFAGPLVTSQTVFTQDQELITKKYVDDSGGDDTKTQNISETGTNTTQTLMTADLKLGQDVGSGTAMVSTPQFNATTNYNNTCGWSFTVSETIKITRIKISNVHWTNTSINYRTVGFWDSVSGIQLF
jgi:hypothetical protein